MPPAFSKIMISEIVSCSPSSWHWNSGGTGWNEPITHSTSLQTTKTFSISVKPRDSTLANCPWNHRTAVHSCLQELWDTRGYCVWPGPEMYLPYVEGLLPSARGHGELVLWLPSTDERPGWAEDPGARTLPPGILPGRSVQLELFPPMSLVCAELPPTERHQPHALSVHTLLPAPTLPVDRGALGGSSCRLHILNERNSVGLGSHQPSTCSAETQELRRCPACPNSQVPARRPVMAVHPGSASPPALP